MAAKKKNSQDSTALIRLQKVLADSGIASRRKCEELIEQGHVEVDGDTVFELGTKVDPQTQEVRVDGQRIKIRRKVYYLLNKPVNVLSTNYDQAGRLRVIDILPQDERIFTVGRLDKASEGLMLVTNDGALAHRLAHPRYGIQKKYHIEVAGHPTEEAIKSIKGGVYLAEAFVKPVSCRLKKKNRKSSTLEIVLDEGKNREIRRILARIGHKVLRLKRISLGPLKLGEVPTGAYRELTEKELAALKKAVDAPQVASKRPIKRSIRRASIANPTKKKKKTVKKKTQVQSGLRGGRSSQRGAAKKATNKKLPKKHKQRRRK